MKRTGIFIALLVVAGMASTDGEPVSERSVRLILETPAEGSAVSVDSPEQYEALASKKHAATLQKRGVSITVRPVTKGRGMPPEDETGEREAGSDRVAERAARVANGFLLQNVTTVRIDGHPVRIDHDCSNFVRAAYGVASNGKIDLFEKAIASGAVPSGVTSGVLLISRLFEANYRYGKKKVKVGDVIIFDDTWDKNNNRKRDDPYTHVGIVTDIRQDGTIEFVHGNVGRKIKRGYINFDHPDVARFNGKAVNSYLRVKYAWEEDFTQNLTSHLVRAFGGFE